LSDISFTIGILLEIQPIILLLNFDFEAEGKSQSLFGLAVPTWDSIELKFPRGLL